MKTIITITLLFFCSVTLISQNNADLFIENPTVNGSKFSWEVHFTPTNTWSFPQSLGDCSWFFNYNSTGITNPVLTFIATELSTVVYSNSTGLTGGKVQITTEFTFDPPANFGTFLTTGIKYHLYTVEMDITNASVQSLIEWNQLDTGIFNALDAQVEESYFGSGDVPLPVELTSFTAAYKNSTVMLSWETKTEVNNYGFNIERRINGGEWNSITFIEGHGTTNSPKEYSYSDKDLFAGGSKFQYRLKQVDNDGSFEYSDVVEVEIVVNQYELSQNYPNPFNPSTTISFSLPESGKVLLKIYNLMGEEIKTLVDGFKDAGIYKVNFNAEELASGMYLYILSTNGFTATKKMLFMK